MRQHIWEQLLRDGGYLLDNVAITPGLGTSIATDTVGGVDYQRIKPVFNADGVMPTDVSAVAPLPVQHQLNATDLTEVAINAASSGDNSLVALTAGQIIRVWAFWLKVDGAAGVSLKFRSGTTDLHPALPFNDKDGWVLGFQSRPWFTCTIAEALQMNLSAAIQVSGRLYYTKA